VPRISLVGTATMSRVIEAISVQGQVANHRKRRGAKAKVVSVTEKASGRFVGQSV
jgi:DNA-binding MarR family transcriptional regulator